MTTGARSESLTNTLESPVCRLGRVLSSTVERENLSLKAVAAQATESAWFLFGNDRLEITPNRVSKLIEAFRGPTSIGSAKWVRDWEMVAFAHALGFSLDTALGTDLKQKAIFWDALASPRYSFELIKLIQQHQKESKDVWGYAGFLPCSLETPEFMAAHHRQIFARLPGTSEAEWQSMVRVYNQIGDIRRSQLVQKDRKWRFNNFMLLPDLEKIVRRTAEYKNVDKKLVKGCMENLIALIGTPSLRMNFVFSTEEDVQELLPFLRDCDTRLMFGESLALWRDHRGNITWSEHPRIIYQQKELFTKLFHKATFKRLPEVIAKLKALLKLI